METGGLMDRRRIVLAALALILAVAMPGVGRAANGSMCVGQRAVTGWAAATAGCTFTVAGPSLSLRGVTQATGLYTVYSFPFPPISNVGVSIVAPDGRTLLSCAATDLVLAQCSKARIVDVPAGTALTCVVHAWTNLDRGAARTAYTCAGR